MSRLWHGTRTAYGNGRRGNQSRTPRYDCRFWLSLAFTVPVFVLAMSEMILAGPSRRSCRRVVLSGSSSSLLPLSCCGAAVPSSNVGGSRSAVAT